MVLHLLVGKIVAGQIADLEVLDDDVAAGDQAACQVLAFFLGEVEGDGALVAVGAQEIGAFPGVFTVGILDEGGAPGPGIVAVNGALHLDHLGPQVAEDLGATRPGQDTREIENANTVEGTRHSTYASSKIQLSFEKQFMKRSRRRPFWILPMALRGRSSTKNTAFGTL